MSGRTIVRAAILLGSSLALPQSASAQSGRLSSETKTQPRIEATAKPVPTQTRGTQVAADDDTAASASKPALNKAAESSVGGIRLIRYGRQSRIHGVR